MTKYSITSPRKTLGISREWGTPKQSASRSGGGSFFDDITKDLGRLCDTPTAWHALTRYFSDSGFKAVLLFRLSSRLHSAGHIRAARFITAESIRLTGAEILAGAQIGLGFVIKHPVGIVIGHGSRIGNNCTLLQGVTLGEKYSADGHHEYPTLGDDVTVCAGAVIIGKVSVGHRCIIGANSVILTNVPSDSIAAGVPGRVLANSSTDRSQPVQGTT